MSGTKFTPRPWKRTITTVPSVAEGYDISSDIVNLTIGDRNIPLAAIGINSTAETREFFGEMVANADLMAAAPEMYESAAGNLETMKMMLECYENVEQLMLTDEDVQQAIKDKSINGLWTYDAVHEIIDDLKSRIAETERVLAKARGEVNQ